MKTTQVGREGKYDEIAQRLCHDLKAGAVVLIVINGRLGNGMSVSASAGNEGLAFGDGLADLLHAMAGQIESGNVTGPAGARFTSGLEEQS